MADKEKAGGCRPVDQNASSTPAERHRGQQTSKRPSDKQRPAEEQNGQQSGQQSGRAAEQQKTNIQMFHVEQWRTQKLSTEKKICREILIVCRQILIVGEDQRARYLLLMKRMKRKGCKNETTKIKSHNEIKK
ncbi:hypothetical protein [Thiolapillus sp.]|uniref:hypothetical protein n=1 Tax=Thiolapillus sp. TaxID=2017437 RepID=UPI003AF7CBF9